MKQGDAQQGDAKQARAERDAAAVSRCYAKRSRRANQSCAKRCDARQGNAVWVNASQGPGKPSKVMPSKRCGKI